MGNNAHRMVTNQLAKERFVRANLIPKLYRLSWQTFWGLLPCKVFSSSPPALSKILRYPIDRCGNQPHHQWSSPKPPDFTLSFPLPLPCSLSLGNAICHLIYSRYTLVDCLILLPTICEGFCLKLLSLHRFLDFSSWLMRALKLSWEGSAEHEAFPQYSIWETQGSVL